MAALANACSLRERFEMRFHSGIRTINAVMVVCTFRKRSRRRPDHCEPNIRVVPCAQEPDLPTALHHSLEMLQGV
jgi:hypothetical protein